MLLKKSISAVLTAMIVSVCCLAAPFMNGSCVHETDAGLISKCVLQCSYDSKEPGIIRITIKTQALAVMDSIGVSGLVINRLNESSGYFEYYKRLGLFQEKNARYALIDNMKVEAPAGRYRISCVHFASGRTKTLGESEQLVDNETEVIVEADAPAPIAPPVTTTVTTKKNIVTTTAARSVTGSVTTAAGKEVFISQVSTANAAGAGRTSVTTATQNVSSGSAGGSYGGAAATSPQPQTTPKTALEMSADKIERPADPPDTGDSGAVPAGALAAFAALALIAGKRRRS